MRAARDLDAFCAGRGQRSGDLGEVPVLSCDGKGVVMCADAVRPAARRVADTTATKLATRLSKGREAGSVHGTGGGILGGPFVAAAPRRTDHGRCGPVRPVAQRPVLSAVEPPGATGRRVVCGSAMPAEASGITAAGGDAGAVMVSSRSRWSVGGCSGRGEPGASLGADVQ